MLFYEADPKHAEIIDSELGFVEAKSVTSPMTKDEVILEEYEMHEELDHEDTGKYRSLVARATYLEMDRPDIRFACK